MSLFPWDWVKVEPTERAQSGRGGFPRLARRAAGFPVCPSLDGAEEDVSAVVGLSRPPGHPIITSLFPPPPLRPPLLHASLRGCCCPLPHPAA